MIEIKAVPGKLIMLGKQGENLAREVIFDVSGVRAEFGDGTFRLSAKRPGEADAYPATVTETGDTVVWALTGADTQNAGRGQCELAYYAGETRLKTWTYDTAIAKSLTGSPKTDPYDEFLDEVNRLAAEAAISQREAKNSETAAKTSEDNAATYAQAALAAEKKSEQNAENAASAATAAGQYAQNAATSATNAASSVSAAETHEKGAKDAAAAAAKSAEGLADAVKRAEDAAANAQDNAGKTAADREAVAEMKTAAQTAQGNAEKAATAAAGSATSAGESAAAAETSRKGAAEIKAQIDEIKAGIDTTIGEIDQAKADIDQTKIDTLAAKTAAETAAATATEKAVEIADSAAQIAKNTENIGKNAMGIETNAEDIDLLRRENVELRAKTDALWKLSEGKSYDFVEDATEAYTKDVPTGCRFAQVEKIGGKTVARDTEELVSAAVEGVEVRGANLLDPKKTTTIIGEPYGLTITMTGENTFRISGVPSNEVTSAGNYAFAIATNSQKELRGKGLKITAFPIKGTIITAWGLRRAEENSLAISTPLTPGVNTDIELRFMVSTATPSAYSPYSLDTYPIPDAVKALPGYGWSTGNLCNEIVRRADGWDYVQRVGLPATTDGYTPLGTPTTTDITDLMTGALPIMTTEPGGTITMHHALADDGLRLDVPNTVKYIRDLKEVASSGTE